MNKSKIYTDFFFPLKEKVPKLIVFMKPCYFVRFFAGFQTANHNEVDNYVGKN